MLPPAGQPELDRFGRPLPVQTFYCQYLGLARDASGKYPLYQDEKFTMASSQGKVQNAWKAYIESSYHPTSPGSPMCAILPSDPAQREAYLKSLNLLTQPATQNGGEGGLDALTPRPFRAVYSFTPHPWSR
jgi:hypothetical protein